MSAYRIPAPIGTVARVVADPEGGRVSLILDAGRVFTLPDGVPVAVRLDPAPPLLIVAPRTLGAFSLIVPPDIAAALADSLPLAQRIKEGQGAHHDA